MTSDYPIRRVLKMWLIQIPLCGEFDGYLLYVIKRSSDGLFMKLSEIPMIFKRKWTNAVIFIEMEQRWSDQCL